MRMRLPRLNLPLRVARHLLGRQLTLTKGIVIAVFLSVASLLCLSFYVSSFNVHSVRHLPPQPTVKCTVSSDLLRNLHNRLASSSHSNYTASLRFQNKVLVMVETQYSLRGQDVIMLLEANHIDYKLELAGKSLPALTRAGKGKFGVIVFEKLDSYLMMDKWNRDLLDKYCRDYNVGIMAFTRSDTALVNENVHGFPLAMHTQLSLQNYRVNAQSDILRITRAREVARTLPGDDWTVFVPNHPTYRAISYANIHRTTDSDDLDDAAAEVTQDPTMRRTSKEIEYIVAVQDLGLFDGVQRVFFGNDFKFWLHRILFLDSLSYLSHGKFSVPLQRFILIDVDDIFVGGQGLRLYVDDVQAMLTSQKKIRDTVKGFRFNIGYSGKYFHHGTPEEDRGDDALIANRAHFDWFPHMWRHLQPHKFDNVSLLETEMLMNYNFAKKFDIAVNSSYAVAPHHSGVYPVHEQLYEAWKRIWGVKVTSTEEYPHLRPARYRRGFIHRGIKVLPRQTCGLFTHTILLDRYPGGRERLDTSIRGGELFQTVINNPISVFMTHMSNYGNDRLALYTFESLLKFLQCWTNLQFQWLPPLQLAQVYFDMYPEEEDPVWGNPCNDKRHKEIWSESKNCERLPQFLVIGPQKTGTTALYTFLAMHPAVTSNYNSPTTFEEVQFFNGRNYYRGLDWYMNFFPGPLEGSPAPVLFEKSANYFDSEPAPYRAHVLLPHANLICILAHPAKRAYSWYQHMRYHTDKVALSYSFYEVISATDDAPKALRELRHRCLNPGLYVQHLERWLTYYKPKQLLILDGDRLKSDPIAVMDKVQMFLRLEPYFDYSIRLKYNPKKGFYCQVLNEHHTKCLGRSKGRVYPPMLPKAEQYLQAYYKRYNIALSKLLSRLGQAVPGWLQEELRTVE